MNGSTVREDTKSEIDKLSETNVFTLNTLVPLHAWEFEIAIPVHLFLKIQHENDADTQVNIVFAWVQLAEKNLPTGIEIIYRCDSKLFNHRCLRAKTKLVQRFVELHASAITACAAAYSPNIHMNVKTLENVSKFFKYQGSYSSASVVVDSEITSQISSFCSTPVHRKCHNTRSAMSTAIKIADDENFRHTPRMNRKTNDSYGALMTFQRHCIRYFKRENESSDEFVNRCEAQAKRCKFTEAEHETRIIEQFMDRVYSNDLQRSLNMEGEDIRLSKAIDIARSHEATIRDNRDMRAKTVNYDLNVDAVGRHKFARASKSCNKCGRAHNKYPPQSCPAYGARYNTCGKMNHWQKMCFSIPETKSKGTSQSHYAGNKVLRNLNYDKPKKANRTSAVHEFSQDDPKEDYFTVSSVRVAEVSNSNDSEALRSIKVKIPSNKTGSMTVKVDTGAGANLLLIRAFRIMYPDLLDAHGKPKTYLTNNHQNLIAVNNMKLKHFGSINLKRTFDKENWIDTDFYIMEQEVGPIILGLPSLRALGMVTIHEARMHPQTTMAVQSVDDLKKSYPDQFDKVGNFHGKYHIVLKEGSKPVVHAQRKIPIHKKEELQNQLEDMEKKELSKWCRDLHIGSTACKLDAKNGYLSVTLDETSSFLTTFNTPFGRYRYLRMTFGLVISQDVFQQKLDQILENCPGTIGIADIGIIYQRGSHVDTRPRLARPRLPSPKRHCPHRPVAWRGLLGYLRPACDPGHQSVPAAVLAQGQRLSASGTSEILRNCLRHGSLSDPDKVSAIKALPSPTNVTELQQFLGMVTYMSPFIPNLADETAPLGNATLVHFNPNKPIVIQVDASQKGIGAALMQNDKPIAYASKSLSETVQRYANIERELLAVVFGCERFHTYVYGKAFQVESDYKPLEIIQLKNLTTAPPRLQHMLMRLQHYDVTIRYKPGKDLLLADGLSRLSSTDNQHIVPDLQINFVTFSNEKLVTLQQETSRDVFLHGLKEVIIQGWPEKMKDLPRMLQPYWSFRDELSIEDGLVIKGSRIIIPVSMLNLVLDPIHVGHQGITKCQLRAKDCVYWTSINRDIEDIVQQETSRSQTKETLIPHELPTRPWQYVGTDLFHYGENNYLIIADYSKFPVIRKMPMHVTSTAVIKGLKNLFSEYGVLEKVYSDNGRQYSSEEFATFASNWEFEHITSSSHYPQSNGFIERIYQTVKNTIDKARRSNKDPDMPLLTLRTTPLDSKLPSPAELRNGKKMRSNLPLHLPTKEGQKQDVYENFKKKQYYDRGAKDQQALLPGQAVRVQDHISGRWTPATVG
ncbi:uncharacterized protein LOC134782233 [Penaeus indicus]|uniref:uncharacterized protein LOC134782233 n=1 Tax=Penaeus indicus TaxID=29960 RepID=UPI00300C43E6